MTVRMYCVLCDTQFLHDKRKARNTTVNIIEMNFKHGEYVNPFLKGRFCFNTRNPIRDNFEMIFIKYRKKNVIDLKVFLLEGK